MCGVRNPEHGERFAVARPSRFVGDIFFFIFALCSSFCVLVFLYVNMNDQNQKNHDEQLELNDKIENTDTKQGQN